MLVEQHQHRQQAEGDGEIHQPGGHAGERHHQAREVHLGNQVAVGHQALAGLGQGVGEQPPGQQRRQGEDRVGHAAGRQLQEVAEDQAEQPHGEQGLQDRPGGPQGGLLVAHLDIAPGEEVEQLAVAPQVAQLQREPAFGGQNLDFLDFSRRAYLHFCVPTYEIQLATEEPSVL